MVLRFSGRLYEWRGPSPFHFIDLSPEASDAIAEVRKALTYGWGVIPVTAIIGSTTWTTSLIPRNGGYALPVKDAVRKTTSLELGGSADVELRLDL